MGDLRVRTATAVRVGDTKLVAIAGLAEDRTVCGGIARRAARLGDGHIRAAIAVGEGTELVIGGAGEGVWARRKQNTCARALWIDLERKQNGSVLIRDCSVIAELAIGVMTDAEDIEGLAGKDGMACARRDGEDARRVEHRLRRSCPITVVRGAIAKLPSAIAAERTSSAAIEEDHGMAASGRDADRHPAEGRNGGRNVSPRVIGGVSELA